MHIHNILQQVRHRQIDAATALGRLQDIEWKTTRHASWLTALLLALGAAGLASLLGADFGAVRRLKFFEPCPLSPCLSIESTVEGMDCLKLSDGYVNIQQVTATEGVGYELQFEVAKGSAIDVELQRCFTSGELLPLTYAGEDLPVSITTVNEQTDELRRYEGAAGFLRPGMGGAGG